MIELAIGVIVGVFAGILLTLILIIDAIREADGEMTLVGNAGEERGGTGLTGLP